MQLTEKTFLQMITTLKINYPTWQINVNTEAERAITYRYYADVIPEEMAQEMTDIYCHNRDYGPRSSHEILSTYLEKKIDEAEPARQIIDKLVSEIRNHTQFNATALRVYIRCNVIPKFKCPEGVDTFYMNNEPTINRLAFLSPHDEDIEKIFKDLTYSYKKHLYKAEKQLVADKITMTSLPGGNTHGYLED